MNQKMYLGPSRPYGLGLMQNAIIIDYAGIAGLSKAMKDHPLLEKLMVSIPEIMAAKAKIKESGSALNKAYNSVKSETDDLRSGGK